MQVFFYFEGQFWEAVFISSTFYLRFVDLL
jgi:hypothetical protein